jgi:hypothetical protein
VAQEAGTPGCWCTQSIYRYAKICFTNTLNKYVMTNIILKPC